MNERPSSRPKMSPRTIGEKAARADRLAAEMRKNLMKRKRQQREQAADTDDDRPADGDPDDRP